jgi:hypothetical protein
MGEFFKGWRRRVGVVTLVMACVFMAGWVRSQSFGDVFRLKMCFGRMEEFTSELSEIVWISWSDDPPSSLPFWQSWPIRKPPYFNNWLFRTFETNRDVGPPIGFYWGVGIAFRYWIFAVPLTLMSLWLLFIPPCKSIQTLNQPEPVT